MAARVAFEFVVAPAAPAAHGSAPAARIERAELVVPGRAPLSTPGAQSTLVAKIGKLEPVRASPLTLAVDGDISGAASSWHVHVEATTFVRDVVGASDIYGGRLSAGRDGGAR